MFTCCSETHKDCFRINGVCHISKFCSRTFSLLSNPPLFPRAECMEQVRPPLTAGIRVPASAKHRDVNWNDDSPNMPPAQTVALTVRICSTHAMPYHSFLIVGVHLIRAPLCSIPGATFGTNPPKASPAWSPAELCWARVWTRVLGRPWPGRPGKKAPNIAQFSIELFGHFRICGAKTSWPGPVGWDRLLRGRMASNLGHARTIRHGPSLWVVGAAFPPARRIVCSWRPITLCSTWQHGPTQTYHILPSLGILLHV